MTDISKLKLLYALRIVLRVLILGCMLHPLLLFWCQDPDTVGRFIVSQLFMLATLVGVWCYRSHLLRRL